MDWNSRLLGRCALVSLALAACSGDEPDPGLTDDSSSDGGEESSSADTVPTTSGETTNAADDTTTSSDDTSTGDVEDVCASVTAGTTADGDPVAICSAFHPESPLVHLPEDTDAVFYGSVDMGTASFVTRDGVAHPMTGADGTTPFSCDAVADTCTELPEFAGLRGASGPTHRWIFTIYRAEATMDGDTLRVSSIEPSVMVEGAAIDGLLDRPYEGTITTRVVPAVEDDPIFSETTVAIRLEPTGERIAFAPQWGGESLADATADQVVLEVANLGAAVTLSDGTCAAPLVDLGDADPFLGATGTTLTVERVASMHGLGEHHIVLANYPTGSLDLDNSSSMGEGLIEGHPLTTPAMWLAPTIDFGAALSSTYYLHGNAFIYNLAITLAPATGGGEDCGG